LSRAAAREYHLPEQRAVGRAAPGPVIRPEVERGHGPVLRAAAPPPNVHAVPAASVRAHGPEGVRPGEPAPRPGVAPARAGLPGLRAPGAGRPATAPVEARHETAPRAAEAARPGAVSRPAETARPAQAARPHAEPHTAAGLPALRGPGAAPHGADRHEVATPRAPEPHAAARPAEHAMPAVHAPERPVEHYATPRSEPARAEPRRAEPVRSEPRAEPREAPHREAAPRPAEAPRPHAEPHAAPHPAGHPDEKH
jgi:hypothetical protein